MATPGPRKDAGPSVSSCTVLIPERWTSDPRVNASMNSPAQAPTQPAAIMTERIGRASVYCSRFCFEGTRAQRKINGAKVKISRAPLIAKAHAQREAPPVIHDVQKLLGETAACAVGGVGEIHAGEIDVQLRRDVIAGGEVDLCVAIHEGRLGPEHGIVLLLAEVIQIDIAPVAGDASLETTLLIEQDQVGGIGKAGHGKTADGKIVRVIRLVGTDKGGVGLEAEAAGAEHVLHGELHAIDVGGGTVDVGGNGEDGGRAGRRIDHAID